MYFRLAAAFGAPTKTGNFFENLGLAGQEMAAYKGEQRTTESAAAEKRRNLALELGKFDVEQARELMRMEQSAAEPKAEIGRACQDAGLVPGTPDFQACVRAEQERTRTAQEELTDLRKQDIQSRLDTAAERRTQYSSMEQRLLDEYTKKISSAKSAMERLARAIQANDDAYTDSLPDLVRRFGARVFNSDDPKLAIFRVMQNDLSGNALASLKSTFPGQISNAEREALDRLQGAQALSKTERGAIFAATATVLLNGIETSTQEIRKIEDGYYRNRPGAEEEISSILGDEQEMEP
jgi:hypothetical protein